MYLDLGHCWPGITVSGTAARRPRRGGGAALLHSAQGTADRRLGRDPGSVQAASRPAEAIVLTLYLDLSPEQAASAMWLGQQQAPGGRGVDVAGPVGKLDKQSRCA